MANLLLIDDDPDLLAERVTHLFPAAAHRVAIARTAAEGLEHVAAELPDVVDIVGVTHGMACYLMESYNEHRAGHRCSAHGARGLWRIYC